MISLDVLREQFNGRVELRERRPGVYQLIAPLYHEDGDMVDVYLEATGNGLIRVCDHAMTLMRLSYSFDLDTPNKEKIFQRILAENRVSEDRGNLFLDARRESLYPAVLQFAQALLKVSNMRLYKRAVIQSLFYEMLEEYVTTQLAQYSPKACQQRRSGSGLCLAGSRQGYISLWGARYGQGEAGHHLLPAVPACQAGLHEHGCSRRL